ncbi:hypothetical protein [Nonomuraea africana]|uniref:hypothetical protein n=1 Tax=Nonomuraea africana TaxID=46171 RepID=UPI00340127BE
MVPLAKSNGSFHTAVGAAAFAIAVHVLGAGLAVAAAVGVCAAAGIGWSRIRLGEHSAQQVLWGGVVELLLGGGPPLPKVSPAAR